MVWDLTSAKTVKVVDRSVDPAVTNTFSFTSNVIWFYDTGVVLAGYFTPAKTVKVVDRSVDPADTNTISFTWIAFHTNGVALLGTLASNITISGNTYVANSFISFEPSGNLLQGRFLIPSIS